MNASRAYVESFTHNFLCKKEKFCLWIKDNFAIKKKRKQNVENDLRFLTALKDLKNEKHFYITLKEIYNLYKKVNIDSE